MNIIDENSPFQLVSSFLTSCIFCRDLMTYFETETSGNLSNSTEQPWVFSTMPNFNVSDGIRISLIVWHR